MVLRFASIFVVAFSGYFCLEDLQYDNCIILHEDSSYRFHWSVDGATLNGLLEVELIDPEGWVGLGFTDGLNMINDGRGSDIIIGFVHPVAGSPCSNGCISDYSASQYGQPVLDPPDHQDVILTSAAQEDGVLRIGFRRKLDTGDREFDFIVDDEVSLLWAFNPYNSSSIDSEGEFSFHKHLPLTKGIRIVNGMLTKKFACEISTSVIEAHVLYAAFLCLFCGLLVFLEISLLLIEGAEHSRFVNTFRVFKLLIILMIALLWGTEWSKEEPGGITDGNIHGSVGSIVALLFLGFEFIRDLARFLQNKNFLFLEAVFHSLMLASFVVTWTIGAAEIGGLANSILLTPLLATCFLVPCIYRKKCSDSPTKYTINLNDEDDDEEESIFQVEKKNAKTPCWIDPKNAWSQAFSLISMIIVLAAVFLVGVVMGSQRTAAIVEPPEEIEEVTEKLSFQFEDYNVPGTQRTTYMCKGFEVPGDDEYHITEFAPIVDKRSTSLLHHMILYQSFVFYNRSFPCGEMPAGSIPISGWAPGASTFKLPRSVGTRIGKHSAPYLLLQIHYDNPSSLEGVVDSSGMELTVTKNLRPIEGGLLGLGIKTPTISIPPGQAKYTLQGSCSSESTVASFPPASQVNPLTDSYTITAAILHMHKTGTKIVTTLQRFSNATNQWSDVTEVGCTENFDFNKQEFVVSEGTFQPGDRFETTCEYNTLHKNETTLGGLGTDAEMCLTFIFYYPKSPLHFCTGVASKSDISDIQCGEL